jgi:serine/threonine protein kinase
MPQPQTIGRYEILVELGHGAMGAVYKARDPLMDRTVAIKTILSGALSGPMAAEYRERFTREARAAGRLTHPGIVTVYDVGDFEGTPYLVMEFVDGRSLATAMDTGVRFSFDHIFEMGRQLADALGYAHRNGVIHRDIKPANILLAAGAPGEPEHAKIADLGVAKLSASQITTTGQLLGTPAFMPPEQFTGATIDGRADLFSLGVILYWLATGDKPFAGDTITAVSYKIVHSSPAPPRRINPAVPAALEMIILKCLEKDPAARYLTGEALAADLAAGRAGRMPAAQGAATSLGAADTWMAPVSMMDGDPNTTLDSDARMQMAPRSQSPTSPQGIPTTKPGIMQNSRGLIGIAAVILILIIGVSVWRVMKHRSAARAEAEAAAQIQLRMEQQKQADLEALAKMQKVQQEAVGAPAPGAADPSAGGGAPAGQPGTQFNANANPTAGGSGSSSSSQPAGGATRGSAAEKKAATKTAPGRGPAKSPAQSGPAPPSTASNQPQTNSTQSTSPTLQTQANQQQPSAPPAPTPPKTNSSDTAVQPQPTPGGGAAATAPAEVAKLHIDDGRVPLGASFVVMMDGKVFFQRKALGEHDPDPTRDDLSVTPGDHEFRVITSQDGIHVGDSNMVRANFQPKKKLLLHIDVRENSSGQMMKKASKLEADKSDFLISVKAPNLLGF